jgi:hypothetical protein
VKGRPQIEGASKQGREEHRLKVFEDRVLRRIFGPKRGEVTEGEENSIMRSYIICICHQHGQIKEDEMGGACSLHGGGKKCVQNFGVTA